MVHRKFVKPGGSKWIIITTHHIMNSLLFVRVPRVNFDPRGAKRNFLNPFSNRCSWSSDKIRVTITCLLSEFMQIRGNLHILINKT